MAPNNFRVRLWPVLGTGYFNIAVVEATASAGS
jgi:hypothetical protein